MNSFACCSDLCSITDSRYVLAPPQLVRQLLVARMLAPTVRNVRARMAPPAPPVVAAEAAPPLVPPPDAILQRPPQNMPLRVLQGMNGEPMRSMADCLCVEVSDEALAQCIDFGTDALAEVLDQLPGRYFKLGYLNGSPVFRQEPSIGALNNLGLFIWKADTIDGGWFISEHVGVADGGDDNTWPVAWCQNGELPGDVHIPMNSGAPCHGVHISTFIEFAENATAAAASKGKGGKAKGKGKKTHGGWMGRAFGLLKAIVWRDWDTYHRLVVEYLKRDDMVQLWEKIEGSPRSI